MNRVHFSVLSAFILGLVTASLAFAGNQQPARVEIQSDQVAGAARILINGKPVMTIDGGGLKLIGDIQYTGTLTDLGNAPERIKQP